METGYRRRDYSANQLSLLATIEDGKADGISIITSQIKHYRSFHVMEEDVTPFVACNSARE